MIALLQRVVGSSVTINGQVTAKIDSGLLVLIGVRPQDSEASALKLLERIVRYRVFSDDSGKMNRSLLDVAGELLLVPQFTLAANTSRGLRPGFSSTAPPELARRLFNYLLAAAHSRSLNVQSGTFGADMQVQLINDGPVTIWLEADS